MPEDNNANKKIETIKPGFKNVEKPEKDKDLSAETPSVPEAGIEVPATQESDPGLTEIKENKEKEGAAAGPIGTPYITPAQKEREVKIEKILEDDLGDIYKKMTPDKQREFKVRGEETARKINVMIDAGKVKVKKVIELIKKWLALIPGINKFFLEQEAKIKADEIIKNTKEDN